MLEAYLEVVVSPSFWVGLTVAFTLCSLLTVQVLIPARREYRKAVLALEEFYQESEGGDDAE